MSVTATDGTRVVVVEFNDQTVNAIKATEASGIAEQAAGDATASAGVALEAADRAEAAAADAINYAGAPIHDDTTSGLATTLTGQYFYVIKPSGALIVYKNESGVAVLKGELEISNDNILDTFDITGVGDETAKIQAMAQYAMDNELRVVWPDGGSYQFTEFELTGTGKVDWHCDGRCTFVSTKTVRTGTTFESDYGIRVSGTEGAEIDLAADFALGNKVINLASTTGIEPGDLLHIKSTKLNETDHRGAWKMGQICMVNKINGNLVYLKERLDYDGKANDVVSGTITTVNGDRSLTLSNGRGTADGNSMVLLTITSGASAGESRYIINATGTNGTIVEHSSKRAAWPAGVQAGDSYEFTWSSTATVIKPARVRMNGLSITRAQVTTATAGDRSFRGLQLEGMAKPKIENCYFENFADTNQHFVRCYRPKVVDVESNGANNIYNDTDGKGYGVSMDMCAHPFVNGLKGHGNRRVIDLTGAGAFTNHGRINNVECYGGGVSYTGEGIWPDGDLQSSGFGSHGSGRFTVYSNCSTYDVYNGSILRGRVEQILNLRCYGYMHRCVTLNHGGGHRIDGLMYDDGFSEAARSAAERHIASDRPGDRARYAVFISYDDPFVSHSQIIINNLTANSLTRGVVQCDGVGIDIEGLHLSNVSVTASPEGTTVDTFTTVKKNPASYLDDCSFTNCKIKTIDAYGDWVDLVDLIGEDQIKPNGKIKVDDNWLINVSNGGFVRMQRRQKSVEVTLTNLRRSSPTRPRCSNYIVDDDSATFVAGTAFKVEAIAGYPADATGVTAGNVAVNNNTGQGKVTILNNSGDRQYYKVAM